MIAENQLARGIQSKSSRVCGKEGRKWRGMGGIGKAEVGERKGVKGGKWGERMEGREWEWGVKGVKGGE